VTDGRATRSKIGGWPLAVGLALILLFLFFIRQILLPFILAAALAFVLMPVVTLLQRRAHLSRWLAATLVYIGALAALALLIDFVALPLAQELAAFVQNLPHQFEALIAKFAAVERLLLGKPLDAEATTSQLLREAESFAGGGALLAFAGYGFAAIAGGVLAVVLLGYFLVSGERVANGVFWLVPPEYRDEVHALRGKILPLLRRYFIGLVVIVSYATALAWILFGAVFHLALAALLAVAIGLLELVPLIGPALSVALIAVTATQQTTLFAMLGLVGFAVLLRFSVDNLIAPLVLGTATRLHPVVVIFSFLSGAVLFGALGLLLAVPVAASIKIVLSTYYAEPIETRRGES
jgi:predicted PurR-regulated permease PerM